jgi:regulatory protein
MAAWREPLAAPAADRVGSPGALGGAGATRVEDGGERRAIELAYRAIGVRDRTEAELRAFLERRRAGPAAVEAAVAELREAGYVDDRRYARRFAEDKRTLERWGAERIERELRRRGVAADLIDEALGGREACDELESALMLLRERHPGGMYDDRERDRAWRLLVRRGYESELAYEAVRRHERVQ